MEEIDDYSDARNKAWCIHCGVTLSTVISNRDHVPTQSFLLQHLMTPKEIEALPVTFVCKKCNEGFSPSEQYFVALINSVLVGSSDPNRHTNPRSAGILRGSKPLRRDLRRAMKEYQTNGGDTRAIWDVDIERLKPAIIKNARGHIYFEWGEPMFGAPSQVGFQPLELMNNEVRDTFESDFGDPIWPEVGSRMMTRMIEGQDMNAGWIVVQPNWYRYTVFQRDGLVCRFVVAEYLGIEIGWSD